MIPSKDLVVLRMAQTYNTKAWDMEELLIDSLAALPQ